MLGRKGLAEADDAFPRVVSFTLEGSACPWFPWHGNVIFRFVGRKWVS